MDCVVYIGRFASHAWQRRVGDDAKPNENIGGNGGPVRAAGGRHGSTTIAAGRTK